MASAESVLSKKKVSMIGLGRLGICTALCFELHGWDVLGVDVFPGYVESVNNKTLKSNEPRVEELLKKSKKLKATTSLIEATNYSDLIMILVATPTGVGENSYDCGTLSKVLRDLNGLKLKNKHFIICCTVPPTYCDNIGLHLIEDCENCTLSYNPEFIAQGNIINGLLKPDMVLIGEGNKDAGDILEGLYKHATENKPKICRMSTSSAEIMKLSLNCFVTTKISYANMIGDIADKTPNANKIDILKGIGSDSRVGSKCILPGYGFGGPCFPRDNRALGVYARRVGVEPLISEATDKYNIFHADFMAKQLLNQNLDIYIISDVAYKPKCPVDIIEESQPIEVAKRIVRAGKKVIIKDRYAIVELVKRTYGSLFLYEIEEDNDDDDNNQDEGIKDKSKSQQHQDISLVSSSSSSSTTTTTIPSHNKNNDNSNKKSKRTRDDENDDMDVDKKSNHTPKGKNGNIIDDNNDNNNDSSSSPSKKKHKTPDNGKNNNNSSSKDNNNKNKNKSTPSSANSKHNHSTEEVDISVTMGNPLSSYKR